MNINTDFDHDLFLTAEGKNLLSFTEEKYPIQSQFLALNDFLKPVLAKLLNLYNKRLQDYILDKIDPQQAKDISYQELIVNTKIVFEQLKKMQAEDTEDIPPNTFIDTLSLN